MLSRLLNMLRRFRRDESGLSALEFAIIAPVMLTSLLGAVEVSNGMLADRKVTLVTSTIADLAAQDKNIINAEMEDIWGAGAAVMYPMPASTLRMRISSIVADPSTGVTRVDWSSSRDMPPLAAGAAVTVPAGMVPPGGSVIFAEVEYTYVSSISSLYADFLADSGVTVRDKFYLRPRRTVKITRSIS